MGVGWWVGVGGLDDTSNTSIYLDINLSKSYFVYSLK